VPFGEKPLKAAQRTSERFTLNEQQRLMGEVRRVSDRKLTGSCNERGEDFDIA
jgi:hypothetical protein